MNFKAIVEYEYPVEHKPPVKAEIVLHGDRVITDNIKWLKESKENKDVLDKIRNEIERLHYHPKLDFIKNDEVVEMALDIIDRHR